MNQLGFGIRLPVGVEVQAFFFGEGLEGAHVANWRIEPDVEILARRIGNGETKVGCIARDVPVAEFVFTGGAQPFLHLVGSFMLQHRDAIRGAAREVTQELLATGIGELEEIMLRGAQHRDAARDGGARVLQFRGGISGAAGFAVVAVLISGTTLGTLTLDEAIRQEHALFFIVILLDLTDIDQAGVP